MHTDRPENPFITSDMAIRPPTEQRLRELYAMANATHYLGDPLRQAPDLAAVLSFLISEHAARVKATLGLPEFDSDHMLHHEQASTPADLDIVHVEVSPEMLARLRQGGTVVALSVASVTRGEDVVDEKSEPAPTTSLAAVMKVLSCLGNGAHARDELDSERLRLPDQVVTESLRYLGHHGLITCHEGVYAMTAAGAWALTYADKTTT